MTPFVAAATDTWGVSGPTFLWLYTGLAVLAVASVVVWRRGHTQGPARKYHRDLTPTEIALLNGGRQLAVYGSLAALRAAGAVTSDRGYITQSGDLPTGASELDRAVHHRTTQGTSAAGLLRDPQVVRVLRRTEEHLARERWLLDDAARARVRTGAAVVFGVVALGLARLVAGIGNDRPVGYLLLLIVPVTAAAFLLLRVQRMPRSTRRLLRKLEAKAHHLSPKRSPSFTTYGPEAAALSVGLFGVTALWVADPAFAQAAELQRQSALVTGGTSSGGSSGTTTSCGSGGGGGDGGGGGGGGGCGGGGCGG